MNQVDQKYFYVVFKSFHSHIMSLDDSYVNDLVEAATFIYSLDDSQVDRDAKSDFLNYAKMRKQYHKNNPWSRNSTKELHVTMSGPTASKHVTFVTTADIIAYLKLRWPAVIENIHECNITELNWE